MINKVNMAGTYTIVVNNDLEIVSVTHNGKLMTERNDLIDKKFKPQMFEKPPNPQPGEEDKVIVPIELDHGCVGFGSISEDPTADPCRWLWGKWW